MQTFDLDKRSALYLTFYSLGDRRDRGLALLRLKKLYRAAGLPLEGSELPDYLPVMLEFAAVAPPARGELVLRSTAPRSSSSVSRFASSTAPTPTCSMPSASRSAGCRPASASASTGS